MSMRAWTSVGVLLVGVGVLPAADQTSEFVKKLFAEHDKNKDGLIDRSEAPNTLKRVFDRIDRDSDGKLTPAEVAAVADKLARVIGQGGVPKPDGLREVNTPPARGERIPDKLKVGDAAPDFTLPDPAGKKEVRLSAFKGKKPVVLIFGSYTWPPFRRQSGDLERMYQTYKDKSEFVLVYIREAHPGSKLFVVDDGKEVLEEIKQTNNVKERSDTCQKALDTLKLTIPAVIDKDDNKVNQAYAGWPDRLYVVGVDGKVAYVGGPGPGGFRPAEVERWLQQNLK